MSLLSLNCRGMGNSSAVQNLWDLLLREFPSLFLLLETKLHNGEFSRIRGRLGEFHGVSMDSVGRSGGFWHCYREKGIYFVLSSMFFHHIDVVVRRSLSEEGFE